MIRVTDGYSIDKVEGVQYVSHMGSDYDVCNAARVSFDKNANNYTYEENSKLLKYLYKHKHWSPFSHCYMKFRFNAPICIARQFQKHVVGFAWNEVSRRYVSTDPQFFVLDSFRKRPSNMKQGSTNEGEIPVDGKLLEAYIDQAREHIKDYNELIRQDVCPEQARMFMPQSMMTQWIWSGSVAAWARFIELRLDKHAQQECHYYANQVLFHLKAKFPECAEVMHANA